MPQQELSDPITLRLPLGVLREIEEIAEATDRTRSWIMVRALKLYLAGEGRDILAAIEGRKQIASGHSHDMDDVLDEIEIIVTGERHDELSGIVGGHGGNDPRRVLLAKETPHELRALLADDIADLDRP